MAAVTVIAQQSRAAGTYTSSAVTIPGTLPAQNVVFELLTVQAERENPGNAWIVGIEIRDEQTLRWPSDDGLPPQYASANSGHVFTNKAGALVNPKSGFSLVGLENKRVRAVLITNATMNVGMSVDFF